MKASLRQWIYRSVFIFLPLIIVLGMGGAWLYVKRIKEQSLPVLGAGGKIASLQSKVQIHQDAKGVPSIEAASLLDAYRALGWIHGRDRFFQMDLARRQAQGRLSEIFGEAVLSSDRLYRWLDFETVAQQAVLKMAPSRLHEFQAYADGVNASVQKRSLPFEIRVLGYEPKPWTTTDSLLIALHMFHTLDFYGQIAAERALTLIEKKRGPEVRQFLSSLKGFFDTPLIEDPTSSLLPVPPPASILDLRQTNTDEIWEFHPVEKVASYHAPVVGSNAWVVGGEKTTTGKPILAGDPHLSMNIPIIWYRAQLVTPDQTVTGVSLPGIPGIVIGHTKTIAWSITNAYTDALDLVELTEQDPVTDKTVIFEISGGSAIKETFSTSSYGPVFTEANGKRYALQWAARDPDVLSRVSARPLNEAKTIREFQEATRQWHGPLLNFIFASSDGSIGWQLAGKVPKRVGFEGRVAHPRNKSFFWDGYLPADEMPGKLNPSSSILVTANQRETPVEDDSLKLSRFTNNPSSNSRAWRIKELLTSQEKWSPKEMFKVQLDNFNYELSYYQNLFEIAYANPEALSMMDEVQLRWLDQIIRWVRQWNGRVTLKDPAYPLLRQFRAVLIATFLEPIAGVKAFEDPLLGKREFRPAFKWFFASSPLNGLLKNRPLHLLHPKFKSYDHAILLGMLDAANTLTDGDEERLETLDWGEVNQTLISHPFGKVLPGILAEPFKVKAVPFDGDHWVPKVGTEWNGFFHSASLRLVTNLADLEGDSWVEFPGGQSGHFQSPNFLDQYADWLNDQPQPLRPGKPEVVDELVPGKTDSD